MNVQESLEADLAALSEEGSLKVNTTAIQAAMRRLAVTIDSHQTEPRDRAACLKEMRAAFEDVVTETSGASYASWLERVQLA